MTIVTLELPQRIYRQAAAIAKATRRPIEQIVVEWIRLPVEDATLAQEVGLAGLEAMTTRQLTEIAESKATPVDTARLGQLLQLQEQRALTPSEFAEATRLVEQEDLLTLRKAKALYLLKQRNAPPINQARRDE